MPTHTRLLNNQSYIHTSANIITQEGQHYNYAYTMPLPGHILFIHQHQVKLW